MFLEHVQALSCNDSERLGSRLFKIARRLLRGLGVNDQTNDSLTIQFLQDVSGLGSSTDKCKKFKDLILEALRSLENQADCKPKEVLARSVLSYVKGLSVVEFSLISVGHIAERFHVSRSHLSRAFKRTYGRTLQEFLTSERMNRAFRLLQKDEPKLSVQEVARTTGFRDEEHFRTIFKKWFGRSPGEIRRK